MEGCSRRVDREGRPYGRMPSSADEVVDLTDHVVLPGLVNTHHHLYQTLTTRVPGAQDSGLFDWLVTLYPIWAGMTPDHVRVSTRLGLVELALSGCTTAFDHHYLAQRLHRRRSDRRRWPRLVSVFTSRGVDEPGSVRGRSSPGLRRRDQRRHPGGLPSWVDLFHDPSAGSMTRVVLAPCSPFSVTSDLMTATAELARELRVGMHTHLAETADEEDFCLSRFDRRPVEYMEDLGWAGPDVWYAHAVHVADDEGGLGGWAIRGPGGSPQPRTCASALGWPRCPAIWRQVSGWAWVWTGRHRTTRRT